LLILNQIPKLNQESVFQVKLSINIIYKNKIVQVIIDNYSFSGRESKDRRRRSPPRRHRRSRSPVRHKSRTRSKTPVMVRPRSRSRSLGRSRSRSRSPYYNRNNKYSSHR